MHINSSPLLYNNQIKWRLTKKNTDLPLKLEINNIKGMFRFLSPLSFHKEQAGEGILREIVQTHIIENHNFKALLMSVIC